MKPVSHLFKFGVGVCLSISLLSGCEAIDLINSVGSILKPNPSASPSASPTPQVVPNTVTGSSPQPTVTAIPLTSLEVVRSGDPTPVSVDWNLARQPGVQLNVSSTLNATYDKARLLDGKLTTSWFLSEGDLPSRGKLPTVELSFAQSVGVISVNLRGDRERNQGLQIEEVSLLITSNQGVLLNETVRIPSDAQDVNLILKKPVDAASSLRLTVTRSRGEAVPGLAEIEVLGRR